jgi:hypothetical protein
MASRTGFKGLQRERGSALLSAIIAVSIFTALFLAWMVWQAKQEEIDKANAAGKSLAQFGLGVRGFIAAVQSNPSLATGTRTGFAWLKPPSCGGLATNPAVGYLSCAYNGGEYGERFTTRIEVDAANNAVQARVSYVVPLPVNGNSSAVAIASRIAAAASGSAVATVDNAFVTVLSNVADDASTPATAASMAANRGRVLMLVDNAPSNDQWLRTDGTNRMLANLNMGGFSIGNARDASFSGNVRVSQAMQVDQGLTVTTGSADLRGGVVTTDVAMTDIGVFASQGIYAAEVLTGSTSYQVAKPRCSASASVPKIFASLQATGTTNVDGYQADSIYSSRVDVTDAGGVWVVTPVLIGTRLDMAVSGSTITLNKSNPTITPRDARIVVLRKCS